LTSLIPRSEKDREYRTKPGRLIGPYTVAVWGPFCCPDLGNTPYPMQLEGNPMRNTIKKIALTVTAVAAIGGLAACGESAEAGKPSNTPSAPTQQLNPDQPLP